MTMIVPEFWAEGRVSEKFPKGHVSGRQSLTVRRFGWSESSLAEAQAMADARALEAFDRILAGGTLPKRDPRVPYDAEGLPIREPVVERDGDIVVTRNSYGARCLNSPNVLFADIDFDTPKPAWRGLYFWSSLLGAVAIALLLKVWIGVVTFFVALWVFSRVARADSYRRHRSEGGGMEARALAPVHAFVAASPDWHLRLYRTPNGFRLLAMHRVFDPLDPSVPQFFEAIRADSYYALLCQRQHCFRARLSPKPWRIGIRERMPPRSGVWPIPPERVPERERWVADYERKSEGYAACRFVEALGSRDYVSATQAVQEMHDRMCRAGSVLPLA
ncbi:MAG: hypothetical protein ACREP7_02825 [Lysobacter sp.]